MQSICRNTNLGVLISTDNLLLRT